MEAKYYNNGTLPPAWYRDLKVMQAARPRETDLALRYQEHAERDRHYFNSFWFRARLAIRLFLWNLGIR